MSPVTTAFSSWPLPFACLCPTTPCPLFLPTSHPRYGLQGPREWSQAPSGEFPLCSAPYLLTTHHHHLPPHHQPWKMPTRAKPGCSSHLAPCRLCRPDHAHLTSNVTRTGPPCATANMTTTLRSIPPHKHNPQITTNHPWKHPQNHGNNPAPRINHPHRQNQPTKMPQQTESSADAHQRGASAT